jgi:hypothetical protein
MLVQKRRRKTPSRARNRLGIDLKTTEEGATLRKDKKTKQKRRNYRCSRGSAQGSIQCSRDPCFEGDE